MSCSRSCLITCVLFFFSSRRRHTRLRRDWSSDVCSSDLITIDKLDANDPKLHYTFEKKYSAKNRYDNFSVQQGIIPQREYYNVAIPDYVTLSYDFIIWTHYIEHMNKIAEKVNWSDGAYWGEPGKMKFRTRIDSFTDATEVSDRERVVKTEFSITLYGYLIPEDRRASCRERV